ncbi:related to trans-aconitate 3-methyltransferase [Plakobranchus ocellatus]|uniref:Related to trans-aconitate 3-methyltransferase n=1 Tax=Plakobranchus ocellatus TaxID=259542 RepID=A0AAV3YP93_9GAST|nr:related to trans-aconitate 3-methyltransferase [Plakobranchus ocellatus]
MEKSRTAEDFSDIGVARIFLDESISRAYAQHRHCYSEELFQIISDYCRENLPDLNLAIDVGCGPGNSTVGFTKHFKQVYDVAMGYCGLTLKEHTEKYPDLELPYPGWVKNEDVIIATEGTPEEYMELVNVRYRGMIYFGCKDESFIDTVEK